ncbi:MAG TPA: adenine phosphoribosyltransferase [Myxococcales bacterium]|nr:adenine phosphoribosyltransferase [Myxococcales bacterium]
MKDLLAQHIRAVPDFPKAGILFRDVTPVLERPELFRQVIDALAERHRGEGLQKIAAIESRGFLFGAPLAYALGAGVCLLRKPGKLPRKAARESYALEYGQDALELHEDAIQEGERVLVVDDLLATGGTASAAGRLVQRLGGTLAGYSFIIELAALGGRARLAHDRIHALIAY